MDIPLQPLRIPTGWTVSFNDGLYEIDPSPDLIPADKHIWFFKEDMLQMVNTAHNRLLDVGWFPSGDLQRGEYALHLHEGDSASGQLLLGFRTRDRRPLVAEVERILFAVAEGQI